MIKLNSKEKRVLHIFVPNFRQRFGGPIFNWQYYFSHWNDESISHYVMETNTNQILKAREAFDFTFTEDQRIPSTTERVKWIFTLHRNLSNNTIQYDILHFHVLWWGGLLMAVWANWKNIPTLYESVLQGSDTPENIREQSFGSIKLWCLRKFSGILAISDSIANDYVQYSFPHDKVYTLMNSIDTDLFHPIMDNQEKLYLREKLNLPSREKIVLFVGSMIQRKGIDSLINAFSKAKKEISDLHLLIIGPRDRNENPTLDQQFVEKIMHQIKENQMDDQVSFTGLIQNRATLSDYFRASDMFVFPSRQEGLPNVVLEAMASGLPVLVTPLPGLEKVIHDGQNGLYIPVNDPNALVLTILRLAEDPQLAAKLGRNARSSVEKHHSFEAWQAKMTAYYYSLINEKPQACR